MKTYKSLAIALLFGTTAIVRAQDAGTVSQSFEPISAHQSRVGVPLIVKNYLSCLNSDVPSIVESALGHVTYMRIVWPTADLRSIQARLAELTAKGATRAIRYKAFMAAEVFGDPATFRRFAVNRNGNGDGILDEIGVRFTTKSDLVAR